MNIENCPYLRLQLLSCMADDQAFPYHSQLTAHHHYLCRRQHSNDVVVADAVDEGDVVRQDCRKVGYLVQELSFAESTD